MTRPYLMTGDVIKLTGECWCELQGFTAKVIGVGDYTFQIQLVTNLHRSVQDRGSFLEYLSNPKTMIDDGWAVEHINKTHKGYYPDWF